ncbi:Type II secretion system protein G [Phycisphaerales bacterium]|nr:Type II secretion system protein G [Phycisphaerales bacterium]
MKQRRGRNRGARGFTLIEVMIVILIVLALGGLVAYNLLGTKEKADDDLVKIDMNTLKQALKNFRFTHNRYPTDEEGLRVLWDKEAAIDEDVQKKWTKLTEAPMAKDRYGNEWGYRQKSEHTEDEDAYDLWSYGRDKTEGTDDDIVSWDKDAESGGTSGDSSGSTGTTGG